jgi:peptidoglycan/xylan/chitin deacetylase (PgdA/CDA1 family)
VSKTTTLLLDAAARARALELALKVKRSPPLILMYHGVSAEAPGTGLRNCEGKHIPVDAFAHHLRVLRRSRRVIPLYQLVDGLKCGLDMRNTIAITFDDGYENNVRVAAPVLADFNMPAAFFLATGFVGTEQCMWTDRIEMALDRTHLATLRLPREECTLPIGSLAGKREALMQVKRRLKAMPTRSVNGVVESLIEQLGATELQADNDYRFMSWDQARSLVEAGHEVGAHTVSHPILSRMPFDEAAAEILDSRARVREETGSCSSTFCFPNGKRNDFNAQLKSLCGQHFRAALATERGPAVVEDMFELKRLSPAGAGKGENVEWTLLRAR